MLRALGAAALVGIAALVGAIQLTTGPNDHPDGLKHVEAAAYYRDHWLPPPIGEPGLFRSFYGSTDLEELEVAYLLYGGVGRALAPLPLPPHTIPRLLNLVLLGTMAAATLALGLPAWALVFFSTAQLWYVFAYVNGEAFSLWSAFAITTAWAFVRRRGEAPLGRWPVVGLGLGCGLLTLSKPTFWVFLPFVAAVLALEWRRASPGGRRALGRNLLVVAALAMAVFSVRYAVDVAVNGFGRWAQVRESREHYARVDFRSNTPLEDRNHGLALRDRGTPFRALFSEWRWHVDAFRSFTGYYGYLDHPSSDHYYVAMGVLLTAVLLAAVILPIRAGEPDAVPLALLLLAGIFLAISLSLARSWLIDFQAQGRHLFAIVPMLAVRIAASDVLTASRPLQLALLGCIALSFHSFVMAALIGAG